MTEEISPKKSGVLYQTHSNDADAHAESLADWQQTYDQLSAGRFSGILNQVWLGDMQVFREITNQSVMQRGRSWSEAGTFGIPLSMSSDGYFCNQPVGTNDILTFGRQQEFELRAPSNFDVVGIAVGTDCYRAILDDANSDDIFPAHSPAAQNPMVLSCNESLTELRIVLRDLFALLESNPCHLESPQNQKSLRSTIIGCLGAALENAKSRTENLPNFNTRKRIVEEARQVAFSNLHEPLTIGELCQKIGVSRRTLQYCFQEILGSNPVTFLRAVRLNCARRDLRAASNGSMQVGDIAARWGFWHLSRFSQEYRAMFGELPSDTLRRK